MRKIFLLAGFVVLSAFQGCDPGGEAREKLELENTRLDHQNEMLNAEILLLEQQNNSLRDRLNTLLQKDEKDASSVNRLALKAARDRAIKIEEREGKYAFLCVVLDEGGGSNPGEFLKKLKEKKLQAEPGQRAGTYYVTPVQILTRGMISDIMNSKSKRTLDKAVREVKEIDGVAEVYPCSRLFFPCTLVWGSGLKVSMDVEFLGIAGDFFEDDEVNRNEYAKYYGESVRVVISQALVRYIEEMAYKVMGRKLVGRDSLLGSYLDLFYPASQLTDIGMKPFPVKKLEIVGFTDRIDGIAFFAKPEALEDMNKKSLDRVNRDLESLSGNNGNGNNDEG